MFTGIIKEIGKIRNIRQNGNTLSLEITSNSVVGGICIGDSVAVNGVCLTVTGKDKSSLSFDVMAETVRRSTLAGLNNGDAVNLEGSIRADGAFGGHFVQGHVDCAGRVRHISKSAGTFSMEIEVPEGFDSLYVDKGSVALDGVSLTIGECGRNGFSVHIIPHTLKETTLGLKRAGDKINVEFDIIGKYAAKKSVSPASKVDENFLKDKGFI